MNDWLALCRAAVADIRGVLEELPSRTEREPVVGAGSGGDETTAIDAAAERAIVERVVAINQPFVLISEELGREVVGEDPELWLVVDPIDGSLNAKRGLPFFAVSFAFARGPTLGDVELGYVYDFGTGEEWTAERGGGAWLNGARLGGERPKDEIEILAFEATTTASVSAHAAAVAELAYRLRIFGSLALSLCHLAAGRVDAVCSLKEARSVDIAAAQLLVREAGFVIDLFDDGGLDTAPLDVEGRSRVAAAGTRALCEQLAAALAG